MKGGGENGGDSDFHMLSSLEPQARGSIVDQGSSTGEVRGPDRRRRYGGRDWGPDHRRGGLESGSALERAASKVWFVVGAGGGRYWRDTTRSINEG